MDRWNLAIVLAFGLGIGAVACNGCGHNPTPTCDDGVFCNGVERMVGGKCVTVIANPCDDGEDCTQDSCDEATDTCSHVAQGQCAVCTAPACTPDCTGRQCGGDGCGGSCGTCGAGQGCASVTGQCQSDNRQGTCGQPLRIQARIGQTQVITGDTSDGLHQVVPACNATSTAVEKVYNFRITAPTGIDARSHDFDTVLHLRRLQDCLNDDPAATIACTDDSAPPGDYGSRVAALLDPGDYALIVDGFDSTSYGPFTLTVRFADNCVPHCDGKFCGGSDGCGSDCGTCGPGFACNATFRCAPNPCVPDCTNDNGSARVCGDDGCGGSCGQCTGPSELCVPDDGTCAAFAACDHEKPTCDPACDDNAFCGSDCACHSRTEPLPDLVVNVDRLRNEILKDTITVDSASCAVAEGCVGGVGARNVIRFSVEAINQGQATMVVPPPATRPDLFTYSVCHGHYHFNGFAQYELLDGNRTVKLTGAKLAYCMEDTVRVFDGPNVSCEKVYSCDAQGISPGWSDLYGNSLDCQWLDVTDVPAGQYTLRVTLNPTGAIEEVTRANNVAEVPVTVGP